MNPFARLALIAAIGSLPVMSFAQPASMASMAASAAAPAAAPVAAAPAAVDPAEATAAALVGKAPPPIVVAKWVKGEPLAGFEPGKVYVVDFWATWCGPCKAAIPHLTRLAQSHAGKVEVVGVSILERQTDEHDTAYLDRVEKFVTKMGDQMNYRVAVDTPTKTMHGTWFKPTGTGGIPTAYIIDQKGLVAWTGIGSPDVVERIVDMVLAGTFDPAAEAALQKKLEAEAAVRAKADMAASANGSSAREKQFPGYDAAMKRGDLPAAIECLNASFKADPKNEIAAYQWKLMNLMQLGKNPAIEEYARDLMARYPDNDDIIGFVSAVIVSTAEEPRFDTKLQLDAATKSLAMSKPDSRWQQYAKWRLAWAQFHAGDKAKAIATAQDAKDSIARLKNIDFGDLDDECTQAISAFKAAK